MSWLLAGVIIALLALVHSELGAAYPLAGARGAGRGWRSARWAASALAGPQVARIDQRRRRADTHGLGCGHRADVALRRH